MQLPIVIAKFHHGRLEEFLRDFVQLSGILIPIKRFKLCRVFQALLKFGTLIGVAGIGTDNFEFSTPSEKLAKEFASLVSLSFLAFKRRT